MNLRLVEALEVCLQALESGEELDVCLRRYPDLESDLRPLLEAHSYAQKISVPEPSPLVIDKSRTRMLARAQELRLQKRGWIVARFPRVAAAILTVALLFLFGSGGILAASAAAIPGDALYALKLQIETLSIDLAPGNSLKSSLHATYNKRRFDEAHRLLTLEREEEIAFEGVIASIGPGSLLIDGIPVSITDETDILGAFEEGDGVEIIALVRDGTQIIALQVRLRSYRLIDFVVSIADDHWVVGDLRLRIDDLTEIEQGVQVGERVLVRVHIDDDGSAYARFVLREPLEQPPILATATPTTEPISSATSTPEPQGKRFLGVVREINQDLWIIGDSHVLIAQDTAIDDGIAVGDLVRVWGLVNENGALKALEIKLHAPATERPGDGFPTPQFTPFHTLEPTETHDEEVRIVEFRAMLLEKVGNKWFIGDETLFINEDSEIHGDPEIGDLLEVRAFVGTFGRLFALRIEVISDESPPG